MDTTIFDRLNVLGDATRSRLLLALDRHELTVSELCSVVQSPQSTVSRHLKILGDEGWVAARAEGTSRLYRMASRLDPPARRLWLLVRDQVSTGTTAADDAERLREVLGQRRARSKEFFSSTAGRWDGLRTELFGQRPDLAAVLGLLDHEWTVGDLGCGTGQLSASLAPFVRRIIAVDDSDAMLTAARQRLDGLDNVEVRGGELEALPMDEGELDVAILFLVLHHVVEPARALAEVRRVLRPGGRLLVVDMMTHDHEEYRQQMGHVWLGLSSQQIGDWLEAASFAAPRYQPLPLDPQARGPRLFAASARRVGAPRQRPVKRSSEAPSEKPSRSKRTA